MLNLVGVGMSQVPTNSMLGGMAYQDSQNVTVDKLVATGNVGVQTNDITSTDLVGAGNSFVGMYIADGFIGFSSVLDRPDGYYICSKINALNAGPVTLESDMTLDGTWVII